MRFSTKKQSAMGQDRQDITKPRTGGEPSAWLDVVQKEVGSLRFGVVQIIVHDSEVVQIERTEKIRFDNARPGKIRKPNSAEGEP